jgi:hypothetical protein
LAGLLAFPARPSRESSPPVDPEATSQGLLPLATLTSLVGELLARAAPEAPDGPLAAWSVDDEQPGKEVGEEEDPSPAQPPDGDVPAEDESQREPALPPAPGPPPPGADHPPEPALPKPFLRHRLLREEDLRKELAAVPEVRSFTLDSMSSLIQAYRESFRVSRGDWNGALEPILLLQQRPDLTNLPVRSGSACRLTPKAARTLQALSTKLHAYVDRAVAGDTPDGPPDPTLLRETLHLEKRGQRPEWLRPEAIPVLLQLLMHENRAIRLLLVEVLAEIDGKAAAMALARRAVFDLAPEVREAAARALADRPRPDYRAVFLDALRYPWALAADHAAEALVALGDHEVVPQLVSMLKKPDPSAPIAGAGNRMLVQEVVRINHRTNCLMCHPPAIRGRDPVPGMVPGVSMSLPESNFRMLAMCKETGRVVVNPLLVRADVTFMRQDFSVRLPVQTSAIAAEDLRFDYLVRIRPARSQELARSKNRTGEPSGYEQREAVLFALRELTGQDAGPSTAAWQQLFPRAEGNAAAARLASALVRTPANQKGRVLNQYREGKGPVYTQALALAIPRLQGVVQERARELLAERLADLPDGLEAGLRDDDGEVRRAAARACAAKNVTARAPELIALLNDPEPAVAEAAHAALEALAGQDFGTGAEAVAAWEQWWANRDEQ